MGTPHRSYIRFTKWVMIFVFLVIIAGSVVRMTQSGMGCPDWPRCFGSWIPPLSADQLPPDYEKYLGKQDIDHSFNPYHTWVEYINRLTSVVLGLMILVHVIWSVKKFYHTKPRIVVWSFLLLAGTVFQAWLGKRVVEANLEEVKITTHMIMALFLAAIPVYIIHLLSTQLPVERKALKKLAIAALLVLIVQVAIGTDVREQIDAISRSLGYMQRDLWIGKLNVVFIIHQILAFIAAIMCVVVSWRALPYPKLHNYSIAIFLLTMASMILGMVMAYLNIPALAQPMHLLIASMLIISVFGLNLKLK